MSVLSGDTLNAISAACGRLSRPAGRFGCAPTWQSVVFVHPCFRRLRAAAPPCGAVWQCPHTRAGCRSRWVARTAVRASPRAQKPTGFCASATALHHSAGKHFFAKKCVVPCSAAGGQAGKNSLPDPSFLPANVALLKQLAFGTPSHAQP